MQGETARIRTRESIRNSRGCYICHGLMGQLDSITDRVLADVQKKYEFDSFLVGAVLPTEIYEREDEIRSRFKIRGKESIKRQFVRELGIRILRITKKRLEYFAPEMVINIVVDNENNIKINPKNSPLILAGTYIKKRRGLSQKHNQYNECIPTRSLIPRYHSHACKCRSVETLISRRLLSMTKGENTRFSWVGSEDRDSLVLGEGRPFFVRILNPQIRSLKGGLKFSIAGIHATIIGNVNHMPESPIRFITKTKILIRTRADLSKIDLTKLYLLKNSMITFEIKSKIVNKKIYSVEVQQINDTEFNLTLIADGGLVIKQFVGGQRYVKPNVSEIIGTESQCVFFDILYVQLQ